MRPDFYIRLKGEIWIQNLLFSPLTTQTVRLVLNNNQIGDAFKLELFQKRKLLSS